jgi:hypothetical protein
MSTTICKTCRKPKASFHCGLCQDAICKTCTQFMVEGSFSFLKKIPEELTHPTYCSQCFDEQVSTPLNDYNEALEKAKDIIVFTKAQSKATRLLKRKADPYLVENCEDEQEALMRISFYAVQEKYNALLDVEIKTKKIIVGSHKKTIFSASATPINVDPTRVRDDQGY